MVALSDDGSIEGVSGTSGFENLTGGADATDNTDSLTGNSGDNVLDGCKGNNTLRGDPPNAETTGKDIFVVWMRGNGMDTIRDFQLPGADGVVVDVIHLRGFKAESMAEDVDGQAGAGQIRIKTGTAAQIIDLGDEIADDDIDTMVGADGRGSRLLIFVD